MKIFRFLLLFPVLCMAQNQYPKDYFRAPLDIPLRISGNFGELRPNHLHSGFDLKTQKMEGLNVFAVADGYVSRIKISLFGYGKAIYITHPNGYTSVYGHLQSGYGAIEKFIKREQYKAKTYEMDITLKPDDLVVKKGDIIALSGNTGGSEGPHLHFEIRDTQSEKIINPMYFGYDTILTDDRKPQVSSLLVYPLEEGVIVNGSKRPVSVNLSLQDDGNFIAEKIVANGKIGFGITAVDFDNLGWHPNGTFKVQTYLNGKSSFGYEFDTFAFDESKYVNALIDYERYKKQGQRVQRLFMKNPYPLSVLKPGQDNGVVDVLPNIAQSYRIDVADFNGNTTKIFVPIQYSGTPATVSEIPQTSKYFVKAKKENIFSQGNVTVTIPENAFLDDFYMDFEVRKSGVKLHEDVVAAYNNFSITIEDDATPEKMRDLLFIGLVGGGKTYFYNTKRNKNSFTIYTKYLGEYKLLKDGTPPKIKSDKKIGGKWISDINELQFTISDNLSGIKSYNGYLNGQWILFEYEPKTKKLTHRFSDGIVAEGKNDLKLVVTDNVGNSTIFETQFFRSQKP